MRHLLQLLKSFLAPVYVLAKNNAQTIALVFGLLGAIAVLAKLLGWLRVRVRQWRDRRSLRNRLGAEAYTPDEILRATSYYLVPDCQDVDPSGGEDWRRTYAVREDAFSALDQLLSHPRDHKYFLILADSGMGKTSLLLNYYARHWRSSRRKHFGLALLPLGQKNVGDRIAAIEDKSNTVLLLDAFDEDTEAIRDHRARLGQLLSATEDFRHVLFTCRTQFFPKDEEIPAETGLLRVTPAAAGESKEHTFYKLYLSPFSDNQVTRYLKKRFPLIHLRDRQRAKVIAAKIRDLTARPMLLAHVRDLLESDADFDYSFKIYEEMVNAWLKREEHFVKDAESLRQFSEQLAVEIFCGRARRGAEKISAAELMQLVSRWTQANVRPPTDMPQATAFERVRTSFHEWQLRGRSLLNRDAAGNLKFAHRTIMEFLVVRRFVGGATDVSPDGWTDQMQRFLCEMAEARYRSKQPFPKNMGRVSLSWQNIRNFIQLRSTPLRGVQLEQVVKLVDQTVLGSPYDWPCAYMVDERREYWNWDQVRDSIKIKFEHFTHLKGIQLSLTELKKLDPNVEKDEDVKKLVSELAMHENELKKVESEISSYERRLRASTSANLKTDLKMRGFYGDPELIFGISPSGSVVRDCATGLLWLVTRDDRRFSRPAFCRWPTIDEAIGLIPMFLNWSAHLPQDLLDVQYVDTLDTNPSGLRYTVRVRASSWREAMEGIAPESENIAPDANQPRFWLFDTSRYVSSITR